MWQVSIRTPFRRCSLSTRARQAFSGPVASPKGLGIYSSECKRGNLMAGKIFIAMDRLTSTLEKLSAKIDLWVPASSQSDKREPTGFVAVPCGYGPRTGPADHSAAEEDSPSASGNTVTFRVPKRSAESDRKSPSAWTIRRRSALPLSSAHAPATSKLF